MFLQPDWWDVTAPGVGTNRYAYSFNDPVNGKDQSGHAPVGVGPGKKSQDSSKKEGAGPQAGAGKNDGKTSSSNTNSNSSKNQKNSGSPEEANDEDTEQSLWDSVQGVASDVAKGIKGFVAGLSKCASHCATGAKFTVGLMEEMVKNPSYIGPMKRAIVSSILDNKTQTAARVTPGILAGAAAVAKTGIKSAGLLGTALNSASALGTLGAEIDKLNGFGVNVTPKEVLDGVYARDFVERLIDRVKSLGPQ